MLHHVKVHGLELWGAKRRTARAVLLSVSVSRAKNINLISSCRWCPRAKTGQMPRRVSEVSRRRRRGATKMSLPNFLRDRNSRPEALAKSVMRNMKQSRGLGGGRGREKRWRGTTGECAREGRSRNDHDRASRRTSVRSSFVGAETMKAPSRRFFSHALRGDASGPGFGRASARVGLLRYESEEVSQDIASTRQPTAPGWGGGRENVSCPSQELRQEKIFTSAHQG